MIFRKSRMKKINPFLEKLFCYGCVCFCLFIHCLGYSRGQGAVDPRIFGEGSAEHLSAVGPEELGSCKGAKLSAVSSCSTGEVMGTVGTAMLPMVSAASAIGEEDTGKVVETQGQATQAVGAVNVGVGAYCLKKVTSCVSTCTAVSAACAKCAEVKAAATPMAPAPSCPPTPGPDPVTYDPTECSLAEAAITACEGLRSSAIAALAQGGILGLAGELMKRAGKDMKDSTEVENPGTPTQPPKAPSSSDNNSPLSLGVAPLHSNQGPGQFAPIKTTQGQAPPGGAPPEEPIMDEKGGGNPALTPLSSGSGSGSLAGTSSNGGGGDPGGLPSGGEKGKDGDGEKPLSSHYGGAGGEGFLSGGSSRRGGGGGHRGRGYLSSRGGGKKKAEKGLAKGKDKPAIKRSISQFKSRHQSIFEIMSDLIQSFCREGQPVCE